MGVCLVKLARCIEAWTFFRVVSIYFINWSWWRRSRVSNSVLVSVITEQSERAWPVMSVTKRSMWCMSVCLSGCASQKKTETATWCVWFMLPGTGWVLPHISGQWNKWNILRLYGSVYIYLCKNNGQDPVQHIQHSTHWSTVLVLTGSGPFTPISGV